MWCVSRKARTRARADVRAARVGAARQGEVARRSARQKRGRNCAWGGKPAPGHSRGGFSRSLRSVGPGRGVRTHGGSPSTTVLARLPACPLLSGRRHVARPPLQTGRSPAVKRPQEHAHREASGRSERDVREHHPTERAAPDHRSGNGRHSTCQSIRTTGRAMASGADRFARVAIRTDGHRHHQKPDGNETDIAGIRFRQGHD